MAGSPGTVNVHSHIATAYIENFVYRVTMGHAAIWQRFLEPSISSLANVRPEEFGQAGSSTDYQSGVDPAALMRLDLTKGQDFTMQDRRLLVVCGARSVGAKTYVLVGGHGRKG